MYFSYNSNIKYVNLTIKCIGFESFHYVSNLDVVSSFIVFSNFLFYISMDVLLVKLIFFKKKIIIIIIM